jgi:hypothetical protein
MKDYKDWLDADKLNAFKTVVKGLAGTAICIEEEEEAAAEQVQE